MKENVVGLGAAFLSAIGLGGIVKSQTDLSDRIFENVGVARDMGERNFEHMVKTLEMKGLLEQPTEEQLRDISPELKRSMRDNPVVADASLMGEQGLELSLHGGLVDISVKETGFVYEYDPESGSLNRKSLPEE